MGWSVGAVAAQSPGGLDRAGIVERHLEQRSPGGVRVLIVRARFDFPFWNGGRTAVVSAGFDMFQRGSRVVIVCGRLGSDLKFRHLRFSQRPMALSFDSGCLHEHQPDHDSECEAGTLPGCETNSPRSVRKARNVTI
jgi:hypothetical protein